MDEQDEHVFENRPHSSSPRGHFLTIKTAIPMLTKVGGLGGLAPAPSAAGRNDSPQSVR
jgi:hypothetical protein